MNDSPQHALLRSLFDAGVAAVTAGRCLPPALPTPPRRGGRTIVVGAGKAAAAMAAAAESAWNGPLDHFGGVVVTRYDHAVPCARVEVVEAAHPVPDAAGVAAARRILALCDTATEDDLVLCLLSGGGSSLLNLPAPGLSLDDIAATTRLLLRSGAPIGEINCVRKHLSVVSGGRLAAAAWPARVVTLAISDVVGDDPATIASGPMVADPTTADDALAVLEAHGLLPSPGEVADWLTGGAASAEVDARGDGADVRDAQLVPRAVLAHLMGGGAESPKPGDERLARSEFVVVASAADALMAAAVAAEAHGVTPVVLGDDVEGEARVVARHHARLALTLGGQTESGPLPPPLIVEPGGNGHGTAYPQLLQQGGPPAALPLVVLSGGELTVTVRGIGRGGPNTEYLLSLALTLDGGEGVHALAADTDGNDGSEDNAGAFVGPDTLRRARERGVDPFAHLAANDAYGLFAALGDLVITGPTRTNVNDFRAILVTARD